MGETRIPGRYVLMLSQPYESNKARLQEWVAGRRELTVLSREDPKDDVVRTGPFLELTAPDRYFSRLKGCGGACSVPLELSDLVQKIFEVQTVAHPIAPGPRLRKP